ncbi:hypothetical protein ACHAWX_005551 [Stephanocyclus meneghinianus]
MLMRRNNKFHGSFRPRHWQFNAISAILLSLSQTSCGFNFAAPLHVNNGASVPRSKLLISLHAFASSSDYGSMKRHKKRTQLRRKRKNDTPSHRKSFRTHSFAVENNTRYDNCRVFDWLLRSTEHVLGGNYQWSDGAFVFSSIQHSQSTDSDSECSSALPHHFASHMDFLFQTETVMKSWVKWISQRPRNNMNTTEGFSLNNVSGLSSVDGAQIVETMLNQTLYVYDEWEALKGQTLKTSHLTVSRADLVNIAIDAWACCKTNDRSSVDSAVKLLKLLQKEDNEQQIVTCANEATYRGVIKACISSRTPQDLEKAINLLEEISSVSTVCPTVNRGYEYCKGALSGLETKLFPTTQTYNLVLYGLANCNPCVKNAERAELFLNQMIFDHKRGSGHHCYPDSNTFRQVVSAWTKSGSDLADKNARRILSMMLDDFPSVPPDASTYNAIMTLYLRNGQTQDMLALFGQMTFDGRTRPDSYSVNLMLKARISKLTEFTLSKMEEIDSLLESMKSLYHVRPSVESFNIVIDAWAKSNLPESAYRAESLLDRMEQQCRRGDMIVAPDSYTFTSVLNAISRLKHHRGRGLWAERVFKRMKSMHADGLVEAPTTPVYNALLHALITSNEKGALSRAESVFAKMCAMANTRTYNIMIKSHSTVVEDANGRLTSFARPSKAKALLEQMEHCNVKPDAYSYTTVICAYSRSNVKRKALKAFSILRRMIKSGIRPTIYAFNGVLTACSHTYLREEKVQAFTILVSTLILIREWTKPDDTTYGVLLKGCDRLLPKDENRKKQVLNLVFRELQFQADPELHASMMMKFMNMDGGDHELMATCD